GRGGGFAREFCVWKPRYSLTLGTPSFMIYKMFTVRRGLKLELFLILQLLVSSAVLQALPAPRHPSVQIIGFASSPCAGAEHCPVRPRRVNSSPMRFHHPHHPF